MNIDFDKRVAIAYKSSSQQARVLTEDWVSRQIYCPNCGSAQLEKYSNNRPVADFFCQKCQEDFELKSKKGLIGEKIVDGAYRSMIGRLQDSNNPNLFLLNYDLKKLEVKSLFVIPKHFFVPGIIEKRKPLALTAQRAGWIGCNILLRSIPQVGKIFFIKNKVIEPKNKVLAEWQKTLFLREEREISAKGWLLDVMTCVDKIGRKEFLLDEVYTFENELSIKHSDNHHIKDKIRQQLQVLRDRGYLKFIKRGRYRLA